MFCLHKNDSPKPQTVIQQCMTIQDETEGKKVVLDSGSLKWTFDVLEEAN